MRRIFLRAGRDRDSHGYHVRLAADPFNLAAVDEIYRVKGRPEARALPSL